MAISGKQLKQALDYSLKGGATNFLVPEISLTATPSEYTVDGSTTSISSFTLNGTIQPNDGTNITFDLQTLTGTSLQSGSFGTNIAFSVNPAPTTSQTYILYVTYTTSTGGTLTISTTTATTVTGQAKVGQLTTAGADITAVNDLTTAIENTFTIKTQTQLLNYFAIAAPNTGRIVIIVPDDMGTIASIADGTSTSILDEFRTPINDSANSRKIYVSTNALTPPADGNYNYKITFS